MKKYLFIALIALISISGYAQDSESYYRLCAGEVTALKSKWPTAPDWKGELAPAPVSDVSKEVRFRLAEEFMQSTLCQDVCKQSRLGIGQTHEMDEKKILDRTINSISIEANFHADTYHISLSKDYATKKWQMDFSFHHGVYSSEPVVDTINFDVEGQQQLDGQKFWSAYCVLGSIAHHRYTKHESGLEASDSSAKRDCKSDDNSDLGHLMPFGAE